MCYPVVVVFWYSLAPSRKLVPAKACAAGIEAELARVEAIISDRRMQVLVRAASGRAAEIEI